MTDRLLTLGIGCRRGVTVQQVDLAVRAALGSRSLAEVRQVATIEGKTTEPGILEFCQRYALPLRGIEPEHIASLARGTFAESEAAFRHHGVRGVSEPCALLGARDGTLITGKTIHNGVTVAVAVDTVHAATPAVSLPEGVEL